MTCTRIIRVWPSSGPLPLNEFNNMLFKRFQNSIVRKLLNLKKITKLCCWDKETKTLNKSLKITFPFKISTSSKFLYLCFNTRWFYTLEKQNSIFYDGFVFRCLFRGPPYPIKSCFFFSFLLVSFFFSFSLKTHNNHHFFYYDV